MSLHPDTASWFCCLLSLGPILPLNSTPPKEQPLLLCSSPGWLGGSGLHLSAGHWQLCVVPPSPALTAFHAADRKKKHNRP